MDAFEKLLKYKLIFKTSIFILNEHSYMRDSSLQKNLIEKLVINGFLTFFNSTINNVLLTLAHKALKVKTEKLAASNEKIHFTHISNLFHTSKQEEHKHRKTDCK